MCNRPYMLAYRYVWSHRVGLARSVHDMAKQMYNNKKYSTVAWEPLTNWLFSCGNEEHQRKARVLTKFTKGSGSD